MTPTPTEIRTKRYVTCPNGCPHHWTVEHLFEGPLAAKPGQTRKAGTWSCDVCGSSYWLHYTHDSIALEDSGKPRYTREFVILELPPQTEPIRLKLEAWNYTPDLPNDERMERAEFFYGEHQCPTNWFRQVSEISIGDDKDPHGLFRFVSVYDADGDADIRQLTPVHPLPPPPPARIVRPEEPPPHETPAAQVVAAINAGVHGPDTTARLLPSGMIELTRTKVGSYGPGRRDHARTTEELLDLYPESRHCPPQDRSNEPRIPPDGPDDDEIYDSAWPPREVVQRLVDATHHLMHDHNCDTHGHEGVGMALRKAERWLGAQGDPLDD